MELHCNAKIDNREPKVVIIVSRDLLQQQFMQHFMQPVFSFFAFLFTCFGFISSWYTLFNIINLLLVKNEKIKGVKI